MLIYENDNKYEGDLNNITKEGKRIYYLKDGDILFSKW